MNEVKIKSEVNENLVVVLSEIAEKNKSKITPQIIIDEAKKKNSILHDYFEWDDTKAAENFRIIQARYLIQRCKITIETPSKIEMTTRAFVSLTTDRKDENCYRTIVSVLSDDELRKQLIEDAKREMICFKTKYSSILKISDIEKLDTLFEKID